MSKDHIITTVFNIELKDPVFAKILNLAADWANRQGLEKIRCTNFSIKTLSDEPYDPLKIRLYSRVTCDMEEIDMTKEVKYEAEFGCASNVNFIDSKFVSMKDSEGNEMMCKCGKRATFIANGAESFIATCHDCSPYGDKK